MIDSKSSQPQASRQSLLYRLETQLMFVVLAASYGLHYVRLRLRGYSRQAGSHEFPVRLERIKRRLLEEHQGARRPRCGASGCPLNFNLLRFLAIHDVRRQIEH
jgi:hypothetical protein